jgi:hypothetical protein
LIGLVLEQPPLRLGFALPQGTQLAICRRMSCGGGVKALSWPFAARDEKLTAFVENRLTVVLS